LDANEARLNSFVLKVETKFEQQSLQLDEILNLLSTSGRQDFDNDRHDNDHHDDEDEGDRKAQGGNTAPKSPLQFIKKTFPWVSESMVRDITALKLNTKDLPKLIPTRFRPKGRVATGSITSTSILYDTSTTIAKVIEPDQPAYDKEIPDIKTLSYILHVYTTIRGLWDQGDNKVIGPAINAYTAMLIM